jgi:hypothetical protein
MPDSHKDTGQSIQPPYAVDQARAETEEQSRLTRRAMDGMHMLRDLALGDQGIHTSQARARSTRHTPEGRSLQRKQEPEEALHGHGRGGGELHDTGGCWCDWVGDLRSRNGRWLRREGEVFQARRDLAERRKSSSSKLSLSGYRYLGEPRCFPFTVSCASSRKQ